MSIYYDDTADIETVKLDQNEETLAGTKTLVTTDKVVQKLDPNGASRDVTLPAITNNLMFIIHNTSTVAAKNLVVKNPAAATLATLGPGMMGIFHCSSTAWEWLDDTGVYYDNVNGYRGIGTTNPDAKLGVAGMVKATGATERWFVANGSHPRFDLDGSAGWAMQTVDTDGRFRIYQQSTTSGERLTILINTGNVGIGTMNPNQKLTVEGTMSLKEQAAANADVAAYGQVWVGNTTPNELWFTDDAGTDTQLSSHPLDAPAALYTNGIGIDWIGKRVQKYLGEIYWQTIDGTVTIETFAEYNLRRKGAPGHKDLIKLDWNTVHHEKAVAKYREKEVEATIAEAIEEVEIFKDVENKETVSKYTFDEEMGKVKKVGKELVTMVKLSTGKFKKQLKDGIRMDADTGKLYRKMTVLEATAMVKAKDIPEMPEWMALANKK